MAHVKLIEFQKRRLAHAHCIFILDPQSKDRLKSPKAVNQFIWAEIPPEIDPELRAAFLKNNIYIPCGDENPQEVCMGKRKRRKRENWNEQEEMKNGNADAGGDENGT